MLEAFYNLLTLVGLYSLCCYLYDNLKAPYLLARNAFRERFLGKSGPTLIDRYGKWAAITGATDGIGKAYARELARHDLNIVLISRTESKLKTVATEIENEFSVRTKIIVADFTKGPEVYEHIEKELENIPVGILVNNVGQVQVGVMHSFSAEDLWNIIHTNIAAVTQLSRYFLQRMCNEGTKGAIVNISSITSFQPQPFAAIYAASKAYTSSLTLALQHEARPLGVTVQLVSAGFIVTKLTSFSKWLMRGGRTIPDPDTYARSAVSTLGIVDETTGYFWHGVSVALAKILSWRMRVFIGRKVAKLLIGERLKSC